MSTEVRLPELGENVEGGTVVEIRVKIGDQVSEGQALMEVEAGKSTVEVPSPYAGTIKELLVKDGDEVQTDQPLVRMETGEVSAGSTTETKTETAAKAEQGNGQHRQEPAKSGTAVADPPKPASSFTGHRGMLDSGWETKPPTPQPMHSPKLVPASPATRLLAREFGVDLSQVQGSAKNGRVTQEDIKNYVRKLSSGGGGASGPAQAPPLPDFSEWGDIENKQLDSVRKATAKQMSLSWSLIPHVTQHDAVDVTELEAFRKSQPKGKVKITVTAFALKASAIALEEYPQFNASLDLQNNKLILKKYYHIGIAVDTDRGLLVPVIRDVNKKSVHELAEEMAEIADRARHRKVGMKELAGGTFTITNLGGIGGTSFTPIINYPEVAILGMSRGKVQPVYIDGELAPRMILPLSLSYDHRVIDGADAARFTRRIAQLLEKPLEMLLHA